MKVKYELEGMNYGGCVSNVKRELLQVPAFTEAEVQLNSQIIVITMNKSITIDELQTQCKKAGNYTIKDVLNN